MMSGTMKATVRAVNNLVSSLSCPAQDDHTLKMTAGFIDRWLLPSDISKKGGEADFGRCPCTLKQFSLEF